MTIYGYRLPPWLALGVWALLWEIIGQLDVIAVDPIGHALQAPLEPDLDVVHDEPGQVPDGVAPLVPVRGAGPRAAGDRRLDGGPRPGALLGRQPPPPPQVQ